LVFITQVYLDARSTEREILRRYFDKAYCDRIRIV